MSGAEIRIKIDENNEKIRSMLDNFILNTEIKKLMNANDELRAQCTHIYEDGVCIYCDKFMDIPEEDL